MLISSMTHWWRQARPMKRPATGRSVKAFRLDIEGLEERSLMSASAYVVPIAVPVDGTHFHSLGAALGSAVSGETVTIEPGAYSEFVNVSVPGITIQGDPNIPGSILPRDDINLLASNVTLSNLNLGNVVVGSASNHETVVRSQLGTFTEVGGLSQAGHNVLSQNVITGSVDLKGNSPPQVTGDLVENNTFTSNAQEILHLKNSTLTMVQDNAIFGDGNGATGITVDSDSDQVLIANNRIEMSGNVATALTLLNLDGGHTLAATVLNNTLRGGSTGTGLYMDLFTNNPSDFKAQVQGNDFRGNAIGVEITAGIAGGVAGEIDLGGGSNSLGSSLGGNDFRGFTPNNGFFAITMHNTVAGLTVSAQHNIFQGGISPNLVIADGSNGGTGIVDYTKNLIGDQAFVQTLYQDLLGRTGAPGELDGWAMQVPALGQGGVANAILHSSEALGRIVEGYYIEYLGRAAAASEIAGWVFHLQNGWSPEMVQAGFIDSREFLGHINTDYVQALYLNILHRTGSLAELDGWTSQLQSVGLTGVAYDFTNSTENRDNVVTALITDFLNRQPLPGEVNGLVSQPADLLTLEGQILAMPDFYTSA
jgi:hypothetical protein